jgi:hypothetical protein
MSDPVKRSFSFPEELYAELVRIATREDRTINAQLNRWVEQKVREYQVQEKAELSRETIGAS